MKEILRKVKFASDFVTAFIEIISLALFNKNFRTLVMQFGEAKEKYRKAKTDAGKRIYSEIASACAEPIRRIACNSKTIVLRTGANAASLWYFDDGKLVAIPKNRK